MVKGHAALQDDCLLFGNCILGSIDSNGTFQPIGRVAMTAPT